MSTALSKAEQNALMVSYDVLGTHVELDLPFVKKYLVRGSADKVTDQEIVFFMNTCKMQGLNPLVAGEVYCIKFGSDPAQLVVGKDAYLRRAFSHPDFLYMTDGITVQRGNEIVQKEGCCLYPGESLIGGWCRVFFVRNGKERTAFKEVAFSEYNKGQANWKSKPASMINKVAISQCVRAAFPKDYEGVYSEEEMVASGAIPADFQDVTPSGGGENTDSGDDEGEDPVITQEQRQMLFGMAQRCFGRGEGNDVLKSILGEFEIESTANMRESMFKKVLDRLNEVIEAKIDSDMQDAVEGPVTEVDAED